MPKSIRMTFQSSVPRNGDEKLQEKADNDSVHALAAMGSLYSVSNKRQGLLQTSLLICFKKSFLYSSSCLHDKPGLDDDHKILVFIDNSAYSS